MEPGAWSLFETVEGFAKKTNMVGRVGFDEPGRLGAVDCLL